MFSAENVDWRRIFPTVLSDLMSGDGAEVGCSIGGDGVFLIEGNMGDLSGQQISCTNIIIRLFNEPAPEEIGHDKGKGRILYEVGYFQPDSEPDSDDPVRVERHDCIPDIYASLNRLKIVPAKNQGES